MFIEVHGSYGTREKCMLNINHILVYRPYLKDGYGQHVNHTRIELLNSHTVYEVAESYEQIQQLILKAQNGT